MIAVIAAIAEKKFSDRSNHSDQMETTLQRLQRSQRWQRQQSLGWNVFCLSDCCRCNRWEKIQRSQRSYGNHSPAIAATTIAEIELFLSQGLLSLRSLESGFWYDRYDRCDRWTFFFSAIAAITAIVAIIWIPGLRDRNTYTTLTDDLFFGPKMHLIPLTVGCYIRKWNSSHNKCVDPSWFSKATTTTMKM